MPETRPHWEAIRLHLDAKDGDALHEFLDELKSGEIARAFTRLDGGELHDVMALLEPEDAADLVEELSDAQGADIIEDLPVDEAADILDEMDSDHRADLLAEMTDEDAEAILREMEPEEAEDARKLLGYEEDTVGGVMVTEFVAYPQDTRVSDVLEDLRENAERYSDEDVQYAYVESERGTLVGVVRLRDLVLSPEGSRLGDIMLANPINVFADLSLDDLGQFFDRYAFRVVPVTDAHGKMVGVARRADTEEALGEAQEKAFLRYSGIVGGEELRSMPLAERVKGRLAWLAPNLILSFAAAFMILLFDDVIEHAGVALVFFIPVIGNMSGCTGNQAVAVSIREMTLGLIQPSDFMRVWSKELAVGLLNGLILGTAIGGAAIGISVWVGKSPFLGLFIGAAFLANAIVSVSLGGLIPLALRSLRLDPALGSPPILSTLSDMIGLFLMFGLVTLANQIGWLG